MKFRVTGTEGHRRPRGLSRLCPFARIFPQPLSLRTLFFQSLCHSTFLTPAKSFTLHHVRVLEIDGMLILVWLLDLPMPWITDGFASPSTGANIAVPMSKTPPSNANNTRTQRSTRIVSNGFYATSRTAMNEASERRNEPNQRSKG